jgi:hypothetical protein
VHLTEAVRQQDNRPHARHSGLQRVGIVLCLVALTVIGTGLLPIAVWDLGDPDANGFTVYLSFFLLYFGWALTEGRKTPVIYLRHFGLTHGNRMITDALRGAVGSRYRAITLDDLEIEPTSPPRLQAVLSIIAPILVAMLLVGVGAYLDELRPPQLLDLHLGPIIITFCVGMCAAMSSVHMWRVSSRSRLHVANERDIMDVTRRVVELSHRFRGARLLEPAMTVVRVSSAEWKAMLVALLEYTENVIVDVSVPTGNLLWELRLISGSDFRQCVIVANRKSIQAWLDTTDAPHEIQKLHEKTKLLLADQQILLYDSEDALQTRVCQAHLRRALDNVAMPPHRAPTHRVLYLSARRRAVLRRIFVYILVGVLWTYGLAALPWIGSMYEPIENFARSLAHATKER